MYVRKPKSTVPGWVVALAVFLGLLGFGIIVASLYIFKPGAANAPVPTAVLTVVNAPTSTPLGNQSLFNTATSTEPTAVLSIDGISQDEYVQITGTGGDGLRLRSSPGTNEPVLFLGYKSEAFKVTGGPEQVDGYTWWYLTAPYDQNRSGWAAANFLQVVQLETPQP